MVDLAREERAAQEEVGPPVLREVACPKHFLGAQDEPRMAVQDSASRASGALHGELHRARENAAVRSLHVARPQCPALAAQVEVALPAFAHRLVEVDARDRPGRELAGARTVTVRGDAEDHQRQNRVVGLGKARVCLHALPVEGAGALAKAAEVFELQLAFAPDERIPGCGALRADAELAGVVGKRAAFQGLRCQGQGQQVVDGGGGSGSKGSRADEEMGNRDADRLHEMAPGFDARSMDRGRIGNLSGPRSILANRGQSRRRRLATCRCSSSPSPRPISR